MQGRYSVDYELFEADKYLADDDEVVALGRAVMRFKATGRRIETDFVLRFEICGGEIVRYRMPGIPRRPFGPSARNSTLHSEIDDGTCRQRNPDA